MILARGLKLAPTGSLEDRVLREQVFRERQERVAHMTAISKMIAQVFGYDADRLFGHVVREYAQEVFQETYDADLLKRKMEALRRAQERIRSRRRHDIQMIDRLERIGQLYDKTHDIDKLRVKNPRKPRTK